MTEADQTPRATDACASCGCRPEVQRMLSYSPRLALAVARNIDFYPFPFIITATFATSGSPSASTGNVTSPKALSTDFIIEAIDVELQTPNAFVGDEFKPLSDANYNLTSGIQTLINVSGARKWASAYFPLRALPLVASAESPWVMLEEQQLTLDFNVTTALPTGYNGLVVNVTFLAKVPSTPAVWRKSQKEACAELDEMGYNTSSARLAFGLPGGCA